MISIQITDNKQFMSALLTTSAFDTFLLKEAQITTSISHLIDGHLRTTTEEDTPCESYISFEKVRTVLYDIIKGKKAPEVFKLILHVNHSTLHALLDKSQIDLPDHTIKSFVLTIKYENQHITLVTGTAYHTFTLDKSADSLWDQSLIRFLDYHHIAYE
ncbi:MAG: DUF5721 family protein [Eubacteriales bacterium]